MVKPAVRLLSRRDEQVRRGLLTPFKAPHRGADLVGARRVRAVLERDREPRQQRAGEHRAQSTRHELAVQRMDEPDLLTAHRDQARAGLGGEQRLGRRQAGEHLELQWLAERQELHDLPGRCAHLGEPGVDQVDQPAAGKRAGNKSPQPHPVREAVAVQRAVDQLADQQRISRAAVDEPVHGSSFNRPTQDGGEHVEHLGAAERLHVDPDAHRFCHKAAMASGAATSLRTVTTTRAAPLDCSMKVKAADPGSSRCASSTATISGRLRARSVTVRMVADNSSARLA